MHPTEVLFQDDILSAQLSVCDHYAGAEKLMRKSLTLQQTLGPVSDVTFDCGDSAATGQGRTHAELAVVLINSDDNRFNRIGVRIHDLNHDAWTRDVDVLVGLTDRRLVYVTVPEMRDVVEVACATDCTNQIARAVGIAWHLSIHVLIETHGTLAQVFDITSLAQVECLSFDLMDFISAHNGTILGAAMSSSEQFKHPLIHRAFADISATCHAHGKVPPHNVSTDIKYPGRADAGATHAHNEFGYLRKWGIHPDQITPIVPTFRLSHGEVTCASAILTSAQDTAWGPIQYEGRLYDRASYRYWWTALQRAHTTGVEMLPDAVARFFT